MASYPQAFKLSDNTAKDKKSTHQPVDHRSLEILAQRLSAIFKANNGEVIQNNQGNRLPASFYPSTQPLIQNTIPGMNSLKASSVYTNSFNTPGFISGFKMINNDKNSKFQSSELAINIINDNKALFKLNDPVNELKIHSEEIDAEGNRHINFGQYYKGIPVWGKEITMHFDSGNNLYLVNSVYIPTPEDIDMSEGVKQSEAVDKSLADLRSFTRIEQLPDEIKKILNYSGPVSEKCIWVDDKTGKSALAWFVAVRPDVIHNWYYFIDAKTGRILEKFDNSPADGPSTANAQDLSGTNRTINTYQYQGKYYMWDASRPMLSGTMPNANGLILTYTNNGGDLENAWSPVPFSSSNNSWGDRASVSAHYNVGLIYEYYRTVHNRNSVDDKGLDLITIQHVTQGGKQIDNAWWNGKFVTLGDGDQITTSWAGALDFLAHEFTHGVITFTVDLVYKNQSGALNEAFADWGGCMIDRQDWTLGEDIAKKSFFPTGCLRDMANPHNGGFKGDQGIWQPAHMSEFLDLPIDQDNGGVHYNSGIINKATYLIGTAIGKEKLEKIYYRVLNNKYINKEAKFIDMRLACVKAAQELYGNASEVNAVKQAFDEVGITDGSGTNPNPDKPKVQGDEWIAVLATADLSLYKVRSVINDPNKDIVHLTETPLYTGTGGVITIPDKGDFILFIDANNDIRFINPDGTEESMLSTNGNWASIAISPSGQYLAAIALNDTKPQIYLFDLVNSDYAIVDVYVPSTSSASIYKEPLAVSSLSWNINGNLLAYDAQNYELNIDGSESIYWDINMVDIQKGVVFGVFPPQQAGIQIGDPGFSKNSEYLFAFDILDQNSGDGQIMGANLFNGEIGTMIEYNSNTAFASYGTYSIDDKKIAFQYYDNASQVYAVADINLDSKKINSVGQAELISTNTALPKWFSTGTRPVSVNEFTGGTPASLIVSPNPAGSHCVISVNSPGSKILSLSAFDIQGNEVATLSDLAGDFTGAKLINWDTKASNGSELVSGYYLIKMLYIDSKGEVKTETTPLILSK